MKVNKSVEQGIYVICILALQKDHAPVKSKVLSQLLQVSDSYLKKLLAKMVKARLIVSSANRSGGYQLAKDVQDISVYDVFASLDQDKNVLVLQHLSDHIFPDQKHARESEKLIEDAFHRGFDKLEQELDQLSIASLLKAEYISRGAIDWNNQNN